MLYLYLTVIHLTVIIPQVCAQENLLEQSKQPYSYLIETIRVRDRELVGREDEITSLQREVATLKTERQKMVNVKNQMSLDLEKLLCHREVTDK